MQNYRPYLFVISKIFEFLLKIFEISKKKAIKCNFIWLIQKKVVLLSSISTINYFVANGNSCSYREISSQIKTLLHRFNLVF